MTISVVCASCKAKLNIPDNLAGKRAKCPKCQVPFEIPAAGATASGAVTPQSPKPAKPTATAPVAAASVPARQPAVAPAAPLASPTPAAIETSATPKSGFNPLILAGAAGGGLLLLIIVVAIGIWMASSGGQSTAAKPQPPSPAVTAPVSTPVATTPAADSSATVSPPPAVNAKTSTPQAAAEPWVDFADEKMGFQVSFPAQPADDEPVAEKNDDSISAAFQRDMLKSMKQKGELRMVRAAANQRVYYAQATALPIFGMSVDQYFDRMESSIGALHPGFELVGKSTRGTHEGNRYCDLKLQQGDKQKLVRMIPANGVIYGLIVEGSGLTATDGDVSRFFASLKLSPPKLPERTAVVPAKPPGEALPSANAATSTPSPQPDNKPATASDKPSAPEPAVPLGPPFAGKITKFTISFPEGATVKTVDTFKAFEDAKRRNETKKRWADDQALHESFTAELDGRTYLITAWRDRKLSGHDANNAQLRRINDLLTDQLKGASRPSIVNSERAKKVPGRSLYTRRYRRDGQLFAYQEIREGAFSCVVQVKAPTEVDERTDPLIWAFFNSLVVTP
jgi:hypothetical protein